ncbi:C2 domain [Sesbania bispinosa]|nr:C2 domain [Sesbania bispinosa]
MEARRSHTIDITILSAENLCMNGKPIRKNAYVVIHTPNPKFLTTTMSGDESGSYPSWNEKFTVEFCDASKYITLEVQCKTWLGVRSVGTAQIAVSDVLGGFVGQNCLQFLSYRLWDGKGQRNGIINFSVRVKVPDQYSESSSCNSMQIAVKRANINDSNGVVTGIPVFWNYPSNNIPR